MEGRSLAALIIGVCVLSAGIGSGITLIAKTGPEGPKGERGAQGLRGPEGYAADEEAGEQAEQDLQDVESNLESLGFEVEEVRGIAEEAESQARINSDEISQVCIAAELVGC